MTYLFSIQELTNPETGAAAKLTCDLLTECKKAGYTRIAVGVKDNQIKSSKTYPFNHTGSVFASPDKNIGHWPAIWSIVDKIGINWGAGNSHQHQIVKGKLIDGVYCFEANKWRKEFV